MEIALNTCVGILSKICIGQLLEINWVTLSNKDTVFQTGDLYLLKHHRQSGADMP